MFINIIKTIFGILDNHLIINNLKMQHLYALNYIRIIYYNLISDCIIHKGAHIYIYSL